MNLTPRFALPCLLLLVANPAARGQYLFSLDDLKQAVRCPDRACVDQRTRLAHYVFERMTTNPHGGQRLVYKTSPSTEFVASLAVDIRPTGGNAVTFFTTDPAYAPQLIAACRRAGMRGTEGETSVFADEDDRTAWSVRITRQQKPEWNGASLWTCALTALFNR